MQSLTIRLGPKLRSLHLNNRRKRASRIIREEIAKRLKLGKEAIRLSSRLNKRLLMNARNLDKIVLGIEVKEGIATADLLSKGAKEAGQQKTGNASEEKKEASKAA